MTSPSDARSLLIETLYQVQNATSTTVPVHDWSTIRNELHSYLQELIQEAEQSQRPLSLLLLGGTGVGKSSLLSALAGKEISEISHSKRAFTQHFSLYHHRESSIRGFPLHPPFERHTHDIDTLKDLLLIDGPDIDSVIGSHRQRIVALLPQIDVVLYVTTWQKYKDHRTHELLREVKGAHSFIFILNQVDVLSEQDRQDLKDDFSHVLQEIGFTSPCILALSAYNALQTALNRGESAPAWDLQNREFPLQKEETLEESEHTSSDQEDSVPLDKNQSLSLSPLEHTEPPAELDLDLGDFPTLENLLHQELKRVDLFLLKERGLLQRSHFILGQIPLKIGFVHHQFEPLLHRFQHCREQLSSYIDQLNTDLLHEFTQLAQTHYQHYARHQHLLRDGEDQGPYGYFLRFRYGALRAELLDQQGLTTQSLEIKRTNQQCQMICARGMEQIRSFLRETSWLNSSLKEGVVDENQESILRECIHYIDHQALLKVQKNRPSWQLNLVPLIVIFFGCLLGSGGWINLGFSLSFWSLLGLALCLGVGASMLQMMWFQSQDQDQFSDGLGINEVMLARILEQNPFFQSVRGLIQDLESAHTYFETLHQAHQTLHHLQVNLDENQLPSAIQLYSEQN